MIGLKQKRPKTLNLCRICLTYSPSMREMSEAGCGISTIREILEKVMCCEIIINQKTPNTICSVCLSLLKISYDFKKQFEETQTKIFGNWNDKNKIHEIESERSNEVELIVGDNNFGLKDILIVEKDEKVEDYSQFINNLGKTVTVEFSTKPSSKGHSLEETNDTERNNTNANITDIQIMNDQLNDMIDNDEYETIIIECVSDNDESFLNQDEYVQSPSDAAKINSFIIEGNGVDYQVVDGDITNRKNVNWSSTNLGDSKPRRKKKDKIEMKDIEKFIIYGTGEEDRPNGFRCGFIGSSSLSPRIEENASDIIGDNKDTDQNNLHKNDKISMNQHGDHNSEGNSNIMKKMVNDKYVCEKCSISFDSARILKRHLVSVHEIQNDVKPRICNNKRKPREVQMKRRIQKLKERFKKNPMLCQICGYISRSSGGARYHSLTHGEKAYKCDLCPKKFYTPSHLKNHLVYKHERQTTRAKHLCSICGEYRNSSTALLYHMKLHTNDAKKYSCPICNIRFLMKSGLQTHIRRHLGDRRFPCNICDKSFFSGNERKKHIMVHTGERPYKCKYCEKRFGSTFNQKIHMMTHNGPHLCKICLKGFVSEEMLKLHFKYYRHRTFSSNLVESFEESPELVGSVKDEKYEYDKYELMIQSPGSCPDDVVLEDLSLLDATEGDPLNFDDDD